MSKVPKISPVTANSKSLGVAFATPQLCPHMLGTKMIQCEKGVTSYTATMSAA